MRKRRVPALQKLVGSEGQRQRLPRFPISTIGTQKARKTAALRLNLRPRRLPFCSWRTPIYRIGTGPDRKNRDRPRPKQSGQAKNAMAWTSASKKPRRLRVCATKAPIKNIGVQKSHIGIPIKVIGTGPDQNNRGRRKPRVPALQKLDEPHRNANSGAIDEGKHQKRKLVPGL